MECSSSSGQYVYEDLSSASTLYLRIYVYFSSLPTSGHFLSFSEMKHADGDNNIVAAVYNDSGIMKWAIRWAPWGAPPQASASFGPVLDTWYSAELNCTLSGTAVNIELFIDGVSVLNTTDASGSSDQFVYAQAGGWDMAETLTNYIDDVIVDSSYIGPAAALVTFNQTGLSSVSGAVVIIDGFNYTFTQLPVSFLWNAGSSHNFTYQSSLIASVDTKQYVWNSTNGTLGETLQNDSITAGSSGTIVGNYLTQYYVTFDQSGLDSSAAGNAVMVNGTGYPYGTPLHAAWYDVGTMLYYTYTDPVPSSNLGEQFRLDSVTGPSSPITVTDKVTVTGNYVTQYRITFDQTGVGSDVAGPVVTIEGANYGVGNLSSAVFWWDTTSVHTFAFVSPLNVNSSAQYAWESTTGLSSVQSDPLTVASSGTVVGNYEMQYKVTVDASSNVKGDSTGTIVTVSGSPEISSDLPYTTNWITSGSSLSWSFSSLVASTSSPSGIQYRWDSSSGLGQTGQSGSLTVTAPGTIVGSYVTQYYLTVETSPGGVNSPTGENWYDTGVTAHVSTEQYVGIVPGSSRYSFDSWTGASGTFSDVTVTMDSAKTATANYVTQYKVTFAQSGVGGDFSDFAMNVSNLNYTSSGYSDWLNNGATVTFNFYSPLVVTPNGKQYVLIGVTGNSTASPLTISTTTTVIGTYGTRWYVAVTSAHGNPIRSSQWVNDGDPFSVSVTSPDVVSPLEHQWLLTGLTVDSFPQTLSDTVSYANVHASHTIEFDWTEQFYLTMSSNFGSVSPVSGWYGEGSVVPISAYAANGSGKRFLWVGWTGTGTVSYTGAINESSVTMDSGVSESAFWTHQYSLSVDSAYGTVSGEGWYDSGLTAYAGLDVGWIDHGNGTQHVFTGWDTDASGTNYVQSDAITMDGPKTATANWQTQYLATYSAIGNVLSVTVPSDEWVDSGGSAVGVFPVQVTVGGTRCNFVSDNRTAITTPSLIVGTYQTQYYVTFAQNGVDVDFSGNVMNVSATNYTRNGFSDWFDGGALVPFNYYSPLVVTPNGKQYVLTGVAGNSTASSLTVSAANTVTGSYVAQYSVTFIQDGLDGTATGTVVTVNGTAMTSTGLPFRAWFNSSDSVVFSYSNVSSTASDMRFVVSSINANSPLTVTGSVTIVGYYETELLTMQLKGTKGWYWTQDTTVTSTVMGDLYGDGVVEIVSGGYYFDGVRDVAQLVIWNGSNRAVLGVTVWYWYGNTTINSVAIGDVYGNGSMEIVTGGSYFDGTRNVAQLVVWDASTLAVRQVKVWTWVSDTTINSVAISDVYGDGHVEIVTGGYYFDNTRDVAQLVIWNGSTLSVNQVKVWTWGGNTTINSLAVGDVDADGHKEIVTGGYYFDGTRDAAQLVVWNSTLAVKQTKVWSWGGNTAINSVAIGNVYGNGSMRIVTGGYYFDGTRNVAQLVIWNGSNMAIDEIRVWYWFGDTTIHSVAIGDVDQDGRTEIVTGGSYFDGVRNVSQLVVWDTSALTVKQVAVWSAGGNTVINCVIVGDVNEDGVTEIVTGGSYYDGTRIIAQLTVWSVTYS